MHCGCSRSYHGYITLRNGHFEGYGVQTASNGYVCVSVTFFMPELKVALLEIAVHF